MILLDQHFVICNDKQITRLFKRRDIDTKKKGDTETENQSQELSQFSSQNNMVLKEHAKIEPLRLDGMPLDEAVMYSIEQCSYELSSYPSYLWRDLLSSVWAEIIEVTFCSFLTPVAAEVSY